MLHALGGNGAGAPATRDSKEEGTEADSGSDLGLEPRVRVSEATCLTSLAPPMPCTQIKVKGLSFNAN